MDNLFDNSISATDPQYKAIRDSSRLSNHKKYLETLWTMYQPYADDGFRNKIAAQFHQRFWEMYLSCTLVTFGFQLVEKSHNEGPDILINYKGRKVWIEATCAGRGNTNDAVPLTKTGISVNDFPEDQIIMRYTNSIVVKNEQFGRHLDAGIVSEKDAYIVAINGGLIPFSNQVNDIPLIVKAVFPIDPHRSVIWETSNNRILEPIVHNSLIVREEVYRTNKSPVSTGAFSNEAFSGISGLLFSTANISVVPPPLEDFIFVHNYKARTRLEKGWLNVGWEFWRENDRLKWRNLSKPKGL